MPQTKIEELEQWMQAPKETEDDGKPTNVKDETPTGEDVPTERELEHKTAPTPRKPSNVRRAPHDAFTSCAMFPPYASVS